MLPSVPTTINAAQTRQLADAAPSGDRLDVRDLAEDLEVHATLLCLGMELVSRHLRTLQLAAEGYAATRCMSRSDRYASLRIQRKRLRFILQTYYLSAAKSTAFGKWLWVRPPMSNSGVPSYSRSCRRLNDRLLISRLTCGDLLVPDKRFLTPF